MVREVRQYEGQSFIYDTSKNIVEINIKEPFFTAGRKFKWVGNPVGVGINMRIIDFACMKKAIIYVKLGKRDYFYGVDACSWKRFCEDTKSKYQTKTVWVYVFQLSKLKRVEE